MLQAYVSSSFQNLSSNLGRILALHAYSLSKTYVLSAKLLQNLLQPRLNPGFSA